ncbi:MAG: DUF2147 domain-containing protein [Hyphomicrobium sp.]
MKRTSYVFAAACSAMSLVVVGEAQAGSDPMGVWVDDTGRGAVEIKACGSALCGHVVAVKNANDTKGCGKQIIGDAQSVGGGRWDNGWIYSPEKRKNYDVELKPLNDGTLRVVGYAGTKLFSRTMIWTRAPADLKRCGVTEAKAAPQPVAPTVAATDAAKSAPVATVPAAAPALPAKVTNSPETAAAEKPAISSDEKAKAAPDVAAKSDTAENSASQDNKTAETNNDADDEADNDTRGEKPGERKSGGGLKLGNLKLGDLDLDKVISRTKSGKCKLDLPWVKVKFDCAAE